MSSLFPFVIGFCLALSFFLSGMEAGVFALSQLRIRRLMRDGNKSARVLFRFLSAPEDFLWTIFVGNTVSNFVVVALGVFAARDWLRASPVLFAAGFFVALLFFYAGWELLPKMIFRLYPNRLCLLLARPFRVVHAGLKPLVAVVRWLATGLMQWSGGRTFTGRLFGNRDELRRLMHESANQFSSEERSMIERALDLQSLRVGHVMVPISKAVTVNLGATVGEALTICRERGMSRLPAWEESGNNRRVVGLFNVRSTLYKTAAQSPANGNNENKESASLPVIDPAQPVQQYIQPAVFLDVDTRLDDAMRHLQRTGQRLAIVLSGDRREIGIISLQDILKAIFGQVKL